MCRSESQEAGIIVVGNGKAHPGELVRSGIPIGRDIYGNERTIPIIIVNGEEKGPVLWINGATHGDEPEGPFSIYKLLEKLNPGTLAGAVVLCPVMNVEAYRVGDRGDRADVMYSYDMNRIYPGKKEGYPTARVAAAHWEAMFGNCDIQINVHSGGKIAYLAGVIFAPNTPLCRELAAAMGPAWTMIMESPTGSQNPYSQLALQGKAAINAELGGLCRTLTNDFHVVADKLVEAYINVLRHYKMINGNPQYAPKWNYGHEKMLLAPATGLWVADRNLEFLKPMRKGDKIGTIHNLYGDTIASLIAPCDGMVVGVRSYPSVIEGEWTCFYAVVDEIRDDLIPNRQ
jgi:uncharacterized protein